MSIIKIIGIIIPLSLLFASCDQSGPNHAHEPELAADEAEHGHEHENEAEHGHEHKHEPEEDESILHMESEQLDRIGVEYGRITGRNIRGQLKVNGRLELPPQNKAEVSSMMAGVVEKIYVRPGQYVRKGARLARMVHFDVVDLQKEYLTGKARIEFLEKDVVRKQGLVDKEVAPEKDLQSISAELAELKARQSASAQKLQLLGIDPASLDAGSIGANWTVRTPIPGYVREIFTNTGIFSQAQEPLFEIVDNHHIHIDLKVYEKDIPFIHEGQTVNFILQSRPDEIMTGTVFAIGKAVEAEERAVTIHAEIDNPDGKLLPGMYVEGRLILGDDQVATLPEEAVTLDQGLEFVFVKIGEEAEEIEFKKVQVITGTRDLGFVEVKPVDDIGDTAEVVTKGAYFLMAQMKLQSGDAPVHSH